MLNLGEVQTCDKNEEVVTARAEKYPNVESVLEMIRTRGEIGLPLSPGQMNKGKYTAPDLHKAGIRLCGTWKKAIEAAGFDYAEMLGKARSRYPTAESVIREIQDRHKNELPLNAPDVSYHRGPHRNIAFYNAAKHQFGSWRVAIESAGLNLAKVRPGAKRRYPDKMTVVTEIQRRKESGLPLNGLALFKGEHKDGVLHKYAQEYFGTWPIAVEAAGLSYEEVRCKPPRRYPDKEAVVAEIRRRKESGLPLNSGALSVGEQEYRDSVLCAYGKEYFGGWFAALEAAGIDLDEVRWRLSRRYPDKDSVIAEIQRRHRAGLSIKYSKISDGGKHADSALLASARELFGLWGKAVDGAGIDYKKLLREYRRYPWKESVVAEIQRRASVGIPNDCASIAHGNNSDAALRHSALEYFGTWAAAIKATGLDYTAILNRIRKYPDGASVVEAIRQRAESGLPLNTASLNYKQHGPGTLVKWGREYFGSWQASIEAAGLDYEKIRIQGRSRKYPDGESVIAEILRRKKSGISLTALTKGEYRDPTLRVSGCKYFGNWQGAMKAAGLDYERVYIRTSGGRKYPDKPSIVFEIQRRVAADLPLYARALLIGENKDAVLYAYGKEYFGNWPAAIEAAGLSTDAVFPKRKRIYPDKESVVRAMQERAEAGLPLQINTLCRGAHRNSVLYKCLMEYFSSWKACIEAAGFSPRELGYKPPRYPDKTSIIAEIRRRKKTDLPLNGLAVAKGVHLDLMLHNYGQKYFGTWQAAIEAAGLSFDEVRSKPIRRYPDKASVITEIQRRKETGLALSGLAIAKGEHRDKMLHSYAQEYFGTWTGALEVAGFSFEEVRSKHPRRYPDPASVVTGIQRRAKAELPLNSTAVSKGKRNDIMLYKYAKEYFGDWERAVTAAGLDFGKIRKAGFKKYPSKQSVTKEIRHRHESGLLIDFAGVFKGDVRDRTLHRYALEYFGSWHDAVVAAGIDPDAIRQVRNAKNEV